MRLLLLFFTGALSVCLIACAGNANNHLSEDTSEPQLTRILSHVNDAPIAVRGSDNQYHVVYELELRNASPSNAVIERLDILNADNGHALTTLAGEQINIRLQIGGRGPNSTELASGQFAVIFLHLTFPDRDAVPLALQHQFTAALDAPLASTEVSLGATTDVQLAPVAILAAPLRGNGFIAGDGCCDSTRHIRALLGINGRHWLAQRFAIDWEQIDAQNRLFVGASTDVKSYHVYGDEVLAVADGTIIKAVDQYPDQIPGALPDSIELRAADGNHIIMDIGDGLYALYAHLQPGSVAVTAGDTVKRGQVMAQVGNSGNSSEPHLHLHVMDAPSALLANGIPYVFEQFQISGIDLEGTADFDQGALSGNPLAITPVNPPTQHRNALPLDLTIVDWLND